MSDPIACAECGVRLKPEHEAAHMQKVHPNVPFRPNRDRAVRSPKASFYLSSRTKKSIFGLVVALVLVIAGAMVYLSTQRNVPIDPNAQQVRISMAGWSPAQLTTTVGTPLKIDVMALDDAHGAGHDFVLATLGVNEYVGSTQKVFTLPADQPGQYTFYCSLCCGGASSPTMVGTYTVQG